MASGLPAAFLRKLPHEALQVSDGLKFLVLGEVLAQADPLRFAVQRRGRCFGYEGADDLAGAVFHVEGQAQEGA